MEEIAYIKILAERGYTAREAKLLAGEFIALSPVLRPLLEAWINDGSTPDYGAEGYTIKGLMDEGMEYPAALLTIDWLLKEPEKAIASLRRGNR